MAKRNNYSPSFKAKVALEATHSVLCRRPGAVPLNHADCRSTVSHLGHITR